MKIQRVSKKIKRTYIKNKTNSNDKQNVYVVIKVAIYC